MNCAVSRISPCILSPSIHTLSLFISFSKSMESMDSVDSVDNVDSVDSVHVVHNSVVPGG
jgi:hypothetical protein